jgi:hypothetical protein
MEAKWRAGSLNPPIERGLIVLADAIRSSNFDEADKIQVTTKYQLFPLTEKVRKQNSGD